jgi:hypothetical protein
MALAAVTSISCTHADRATSGANRTKTQDPVRITQFYATKQVIARGEDALLCYGVENATDVRLTPEVESIRLWSGALQYLLRRLRPLL